MKQPTVCPHGVVVKSQCRTCRLAYQSAYNAAHREKMREQLKQADKLRRGMIAGDYDIECKKVVVQINGRFFEQIRLRELNSKENLRNARVRKKLYGRDSIPLGYKKIKSSVPWMPYPADKKFEKHKNACHGGKVDPKCLACKELENKVVRGI